MADHPNAELLRKGYDAFASGDMDAVGEFFSDDIAWHVANGGVLSGDYKGKEEVFGFFGRLAQETGGNFSNEIHDVLANDQHGVALIRLKAERNGKAIDMNGVHVWHVADGKATEFWGFPEDTAKANEFWS